LKVAATESLAGSARAASNDHDSDPIAPAVRLEESATAALLRAYLRVVARHSAYSAVDHRGRGIDLDGLADVVGAYGERLVATYWIDNALPLATLSFAHPGLTAFARQFRFLIDDTYGGRLSAHSIASVGGRYAMLAVPGNPLRLKQVSALIREGGSCIFPVDGGGPYRRAGTGIVGLATALKAAIVPLAVRASRSFALPHRSRVRVPFPGGRVVVGVGAPIPVQKTDIRRDVAARVQRALNEMDRVVGGTAARYAAGLVADRYRPPSESV
jgi:hypothetical protein